MCVTAPCWATFPRKLIYCSVSRWLKKKKNKKNPNWNTNGTDSSIDHLPSKLGLKVLLFAAFTLPRWLLNQNIIMFFLPWFLLRKHSSRGTKPWKQEISESRWILFLSPSPRGSGLKVTFLIFPRPCWIEYCSQGELTAYLPPPLAMCGLRNTWNTFPAKALQSVRVLFLGGKFPSSFEM